MDDFIKGLVVGGIIGGALGILYAPKSGKKTRADISKSADDLYDKTKDHYEHGLKKIEEMVDQGSDQYTEKKEKLKKSIEAGVKTLKEDLASFRKA